MKPPPRPYKPLFIYPADNPVLDPTRIVIGFHGTLASMAHQIINEQRLDLSENEYDWLGRGAYFWCDYDYRAWQWAQRCAQSAQEADGITRPFAVVKASIRLGNCIDIHSGLFGDMIRTAEEKLKQNYSQRDVPVPKNRGGAHYLDCAVFNFLCEHMNLPIHTIRALIPEGPPLLQGSPMGEGNHIHLCARTMEVVKNLEIVAIRQE